MAPARSAMAVATRRQPSKRQTISFLDLPAEIRNEIYMLFHDFRSIKHVPLVDSNIKRIRESHPDSRRAPVRMPAFLGLCKQIRMEFMPILLHKAAITFTVVNFDFRQVTRFLKRLSPVSLDLVRANRNVKIVIVLLGCPTLDRLYDWLRYQALAMQRQRWYYETAEDYDVTHTLASMQRLHENMFSKDMKAVLGHLMDAFRSFASYGQSPP
ncbi:hypothetical protein MBLNU459_g6983t2 [Dothideomycetes sp. NU459]